jgi:uncharacterized protein YjbJ (UPF0337 family)
MAVLILIINREEIRMNDDIFKGKWNQLKGDVQKTWGKQTNDDLDVIQGDTTKLSGILQERYGMAKEKAEIALKEFQDRNR